MAFCTKCGAEISDNAAFCTSCGEPISNDKQKQPNDGSGVPTFTPPTPTFEPPKNEKPQFNGPACYYHKDEPAVAKLQDVANIFVRIVLITTVCPVVIMQVRLFAMIAASNSLLKTLMN